MRVVVGAECGTCLFSTADTRGGSEGTVDRLAPGTSPIFVQTTRCSLAITLLGGLATSCFQSEITVYLR
jgi:hypothetical protein